MRLPFTKKQGTLQGDGKSYEGNMNILELMCRKDLKACVYKESGGYLPSEHTPVISDAAKNLAKRVYL